MSSNRKQSKHNKSFKPKSKKQTAKDSKSNKASTMVEDKGAVQLSKRKFCTINEKEYEHYLDKREERTRICCYNQFVFGQDLLQPESSIIQYKMFQYPFGKLNQETLQRTICSLLNAKGGHIFIGVRESQEKKRTAVGLFLSEAQKESIYREMRMIAKSIKPDIIINQKVSTYFVPLKDKRVDGQFMQGRYIIKVEVKQGDPRLLYSVNRDKSQIYYLRYQSECILINKELVTKEVNKRKNLKPYVQCVHKCPEPFIGKPSYHSENIQKRRKEDTFTVIKILKIPRSSIQPLKRFVGGNRINYDLEVIDHRKTEEQFIRLKLQKDILGLDKRIEELQGSLINEELIKKAKEDIFLKNNNKNSHQKLPSSEVSIEGWRHQSSIITSNQAERNFSWKRKYPLINSREYTKESPAKLNYKEILQCNSISKFSIEQEQHKNQGRNVDFMSKLLPETSTCTPEGMSY